MSVHPFSSEHLQALRADTPAAERSIHLNNAGASLVPGPVQEAVQHYLAEEAQGGGYETAARRASDIQAFYPQLARLFGGMPSQYAYCSSATDAFKKALSSLPVRAGDTWLTTRHDYASNQIALLQASERFGLRLLVARDREEGGVDPDDLQRLLRLHKPRLVVVTQVPSHTGLVQPVAEIGQLCRAAGA
jgi:selenocysteine lyase/cysteine desulfurase